MMGFKRPTPIQAACIPAILAKRDVMGCAETGSGKTAAFALPILHTLSEDPYGIYAVVLTPTRELAVQISEQFTALGAPIGCRVCLIIGGLNMTEQALQLSKRPHIVIATPGRLRAHLLSADPPSLSKARYIVLDEADRLLTQGFEAELQMILSAMPDRRQTLLFSATLTTSLAQLETMAMKETLRFDLTNQTLARVPAQLTQKYLFIPAQVKMSYLVAFLHKQIAQSSEKDDEPKKKSSKKSHTPKDAAVELPFLLIIFVNTCKRCQEMSETLLQLQMNNVCLHSMMTQTSRLTALSKFRNQVARILVCTDVASRGLDIPHVDIVLNFDIPKITSDYIHRIGRTARAGNFAVFTKFGPFLIIEDFLGKQGMSVTFVTQYDVEMVQSIEDYIGVKMELYPHVKEEDVVKVLNVVAKASRVAELKLLEQGFDERVVQRESRKRKQKRKILRKVKAKVVGSSEDAT